MWADLATIGGAILLVAFLLIVAGIALCARYDRQPFNGRNAQVDAQEGNRRKTRPELRTEVTTTRSLTGTTPVTREIDTRPSSTFRAAPHSRAGFRAVSTGGAFLLQRSR